MVDFVHNRLNQGKEPEDIASDLLDRCVASDPRESKGIGCDNMTCCILLFKQINGSESPKMANGT